MSTVITVENVSKAYRLGQIGGGTLKEDFSRWCAKLRGKPDPFLKIGEEHHARHMGEKFWALDDVSFEVKEGEALGIIGRNGAGKSTLLKILSQVTTPTTGQIKIRGRIASLLEVGTGFQPELTGRENVFLNGAILGMTKAEIRSKFDEIVAFSGVEEFIDTPVKRYSSGMYVRLAFAVAAHLEPEILIIDEVLAVGDVEFQKKCIGKMGQASKAGRTVIIVSHNLALVSTLCRRAVHLDAGKKRMEGDAEEVVSAYIQLGAASAGEAAWDATDRNSNNGRLRLIRASVLCEGKITSDVKIDKPVTLQYDFEVITGNLNVSSSIHLLDKHTVCVLASGTPSRVLEKGVYRHSCVIPANLLNDTSYSVRILILTDTIHCEVCIEDAVSLTVHETKRNGEFMGTIIGCIRPQLQWEHRSIQQCASPVSGCLVVNV